MVGMLYQGNPVVVVEGEAVVHEAATVPGSEGRTREIHDGSMRKTERKAGRNE